MRTNIKTTNITLTDAISAYVNKRLEKIEKLIGDDTSVQCDVELGRTTAHHNKGEIFKCEVHLVGSNINIYNSVDREDLYVAIDEVRDMVIQELKSGKKKQASRIRRGGAMVKAMMRGMWPWRKR